MTEQHNHVNDANINNPEPPTKKRKPWITPKRSDLPTRFTAGTNTLGIPHEPAFSSSIYAPTS